MNYNIHIPIIRLFLLQFFASSSISYPNAINIRKISSRTGPQLPQAEAVLQQLESGRLDVFCFRIEDEVGFDQLMRSWRRIPFEASLVSTNLNERVDGVACPAKSCNQVHVVNRAKVFMCDVASLLEGISVCR